MSIKITDNSLSVKARVRSNALAALNAMGTAGVEFIREQMRTGYGAPIRKTGALEASIAYEVDKDAQQVIIGSELEYAQYVHEGTVLMIGRPFIRDGIANNRQALQDAAEQAFSEV